MVETFSIDIDGRVVTVVDTPSFNNTNISDTDVLCELASWLTESYKSRRPLSGIVYMHDITSAKIGASSRKNLKLFRNLVGSEAFCNTLLVTSKWDLLSDPAVGAMREDELRYEWRKNLIGHDSSTARSSGDTKSALAIIKNIAFGRSTGVSADIPIALQKEMVDEHRPLEDTSAGRVLKQWMDVLEQFYETCISELMADHGRESAETTEEIRVMQTELNRLHGEQLALRDAQFQFEDRPSGSIQDRVEFPVQYTKSEFEMEMKANELMGVDLPPPYSPQAPSQVTVSLTAVTDTIASPSSLINGAYRFLKPVASKLFRPRLQKDHSRIEWTCVSPDRKIGVVKSDPN
jgi:hypothetical protein